MAKCLIIAGVLLVSQGVLAQVANVISNPGFEEGQDAPRGWDLGMEGRGRGSATRVTENPHSGKYCVRLELEEAGDYWMARQRFAAGTAKPAHAYRISGWYRGTEGAAHPCVYFLDPAGAFLGAWETTLPATADWKPFDVVFTTRPNTDHLELQLRTQGGKGVSWFDDVALEDAEELLRQGSEIVAPLLRVAEQHPDYLWAIVSNGGRAEFEFVGGPEMTVAWAVANAEEATEAGYGIGQESFGPGGGGSIIAHPTIDGREPTEALQTHRLRLFGATRATRIVAYRDSDNLCPGPILLVGVKLDEAVAGSLARLEAFPVSRSSADLRIPWETRVLEDSQARFEGVRAEHRSEILRKALGATGPEAVARVYPGWFNFTDQQWLDWALKKTPVEEPPYGGTTNEKPSYDGTTNDPSSIAAGARNEYLSAQVLYVPPGQPQKVVVRLSDFKADDATIPATAGQVRMLEYVPLAGQWYPDPLLEDQPFTPSAHGPIVFWLTIHVPAEAKPGTYRATIAMRADDEPRPPHEFKVTTKIKKQKYVVGLNSWGAPETTREFAIRVWNVALPSETHLHTSFWLSRGQINRYFELPGDVPMEDYTPYIDLATSHRLSPVDFVEGPTVPMVKAYREADGRLSYDFSTWDQYLDRLQRGGANTVHLGFTHWMGHYFTGSNPPVINRQTGQTVALGYEFGSEAHLDALARYLRAAADHVKERGFDFMYIQPWDEPSGEGLAKSYTILKGLQDRVPDIPRLMTAVGPGSFDGKMAEVVSLWCPLSPSVEGGAFDAMRERGDIVWWYVCCGPGQPYANLFTHWKVPEMRVLFWQTWQYRITGILYWSMNYWLGWGTPIPPAEERFPRGVWKSDTIMGDGYFIYPGTAVNKPLSSLRLETLRDGIEDYELLYLLNSRVEQNPQADAATLEQARESLKVPPTVSKNLIEFDRDGAGMDAAREEIARLIEELQ